MKKSSSSAAVDRKQRGLFSLTHALLLALVLTMAPAVLAQLPAAGPKPASAPKAAPEAAAAPNAGPPTDDSALNETMAAKPLEAESLYQLFRKGGFFMYPLLASSIIALALIIERAIALRRGLVVPPNFIPGLRAVYRDPIRDREAGMAYCRTDNSSLSRMVAAGIRRITHGHVAVEKAIEDAGANEALKLRRNMRVLYAVGSVATLLGLIGTIYGMIQAFRVASAGGLGKSELLAKGIYEAMVCTFSGLAVAILVTVFYYYFVGRIERLVSDLNDEVTEFATTYIDNLPSLKQDAEQPEHSGPTATSELTTPLPEFSLAR